ncbi:ASCH domain-containing protein [Jeotgalibacillus sp. R-1-5s-1]|uniref:ASCH domain-containing protein n=1 Tax=Jeotgalibacillus sp. R-1-5s-1 TaxID=2555897 RepID=UPI00106B77BB|nr:ASCH domain-containing protein [Jeotgalibacillus sp. R-1-5s-1]TFD94405.1 ASCH domain-containing protein [Jeotgalibacillus sp. R-1-5s-1]
MNKAAQKYWNKYWESQTGDKPQKVSAWQFGESPDYLAQLVIDGIKTATCSGHVFYELENEPLPAVNDYNIILNGADEPVVMTRTVSVQIMPMNEVPEEFAVAEGEGDRTYQYWWDTHVRFFKEDLGRVGLSWSEDMMVVCERFEVVDVIR